MSVVQQRLLASAFFACTLLAAPAQAEDPGPYDDSKNSSSPNYGWEFAEAPDILIGDWTQNGGLDLRVTKFYATHGDRHCNRRSTVKRNNTWLLVCEEKDPTYGVRLWGIYMRPWEGKRWQFADSRPARTLEALTSGDPDERTWFTYTRSDTPIAGGTPAVTVQAPTTQGPSAPQAPTQTGDATFTKEELESFKVDNTVPAPPNQPYVWWAGDARGFEMMQAGVEDGEPLYVCRAKVKGEYITGQVQAKLGAWCRIAYNGKERKRAPFEHLLQRKGDEPTLGWAPLRKEDPVFMRNAQRFAFRTGGTVICRVKQGNGDYPLGHVVQGNACMYGYRGEQRLETDAFEALIKPPKV